MHAAPGTLSPGTLSPGFSDPVHDAQAAFRALLEATARPGTIVTPRAPASPPAGLPPAMAAVALTLVDAETTLWLGEAMADTASEAWLRFHCGCRIVPQPDEAAFAFAGAEAAPFDRFLTGTDEYPDGGATLVLAVDALGSGETLRLAGPGIDGAATLAVAGLPRRFLAWRSEARALFPRGVDVLLVAGGSLAALPRSTTISAGGG